MDLYEASGIEVERSDATDHRRPHDGDPDAILKAGFELALVLVDAAHDAEFAQWPSSEISAHQSDV